MSKDYTRITDEIYSKILNDLIEEKEIFNDVRNTAPRILMIAVSNSDKEGVVLPAFKGLPYEIKINGIKDRIISNYDVIFYLDQMFINDCITEREIEALIYSCLNRLEFGIDKNGYYIIENDGRYKIKLRTPDMSFEGFSEVADEYKQDSPEMKIYNRVISDNAEVFNKVM